MQDRAAAREQAGPLHPNVQNVLWQTGPVTTSGRGLWGSHMNADERTLNRIANVVVGLIGLAGLWLLAQFVPVFVAAVLMAGSFLVFLLALIGFIKPSWVRLPNRLASVWLIFLSVGMFIGGGALLNQDEDEISTANGAPPMAPPGTSTSLTDALGRELRRPSVDMTTPAPMAPELAEAATQRVADENARRRREARGRAAPLPADRHTDDPTRWEIPEPWLAAACSPWEIGVRVCFGVTAEHVLLESSLPQIIGDEWTVRIGGNEWTGRVSTQGNVVWTGSDHTGMTVLMMVAGAEGHVDDDVLRWSDQAIVTDADGMEFRVSLRGAGEAIRQAVYR